jgi:hypothetical protein
MDTRAEEIAARIYRTRVSVSAARDITDPAAETRIAILFAVAVEIVSAERVQRNLNTSVEGLAGVEGTFDAVVAINRFMTTPGLRVAYVDRAGVCIVAVTRDDNALLLCIADIQRARLGIAAVRVRLAPRDQTLPRRHGLGHTDPGAGVADSHDTLRVKQRAVQGLVQTTPLRVAALDATGVAIIAIDRSLLAAEVFIAGIRRTCATVVAVTWGASCTYTARATIVRCTRISVVAGHGVRHDPATVDGVAAFIGARVAVVADNGGACTTLTVLASVVSRAGIPVVARVDIGQQNAALDRVAQRVHTGVRAIAQGIVRQRDATVHDRIAEVLGA